MLIATLNRDINNIISRYSQQNIYTYKLGLARSMLALSSLLTLILNDSSILFNNGEAFHAISFSQEMYFLQKFNLFILFGQNNLGIAKSLAILILFLSASGWQPKITCLFHVWVCVSFNHAAVLIEGGDQIASNLALMLVPICLLDSRSWHWKSNKPADFQAEKLLIANYFLFIIKLQMCLLYFHAGVGKIPMKEWSNGTAVYYWFNDPVFGMRDWMHVILDPILSNPYGVALLTWGTMLLEITLFCAILMSKRSRYILFILGLLFHLSIIVIHGLFSFFISMSAGLMLYLWVDNSYGNILPYVKTFPLKFKASGLFHRTKAQF